MADHRPSFTPGADASAAATNPHADHQSTPRHASRYSSNSSAGPAVVSSHHRPNSNPRYSGSSFFSDDALSDIYAHNHYRLSTHSSDPPHPEYRHHLLNDDEDDDEEEEEEEQQEEVEAEEEEGDQEEKASIPKGVVEEDDSDYDYRYDYNSDHDDLDHDHDPYHYQSSPHERATSLPSPPRTSSLRKSRLSNVVNLLDRPASVDSPSVSKSKPLDVEKIAQDSHRQESHHYHLNTHYPQETSTSPNNSKFSALLIPDQSTVSTTSWLLDASASASPTIVPRDLDRFPRGSSPSLNPTQADASHEHERSDEATLSSQVYRKPSYNESFLNVSQGTSSRPRTQQSAASFHTAQNSIDNSEFEEYHEDAGTAHPADENFVASETATPTLGDPQRLTMSPKVVPHPAAQNLTLKIDASAAHPSLLHDPNDLSALDSKRPKSPGGKISSFFGWRNSPKATDSPTTPFSDARSMSFENSPGGGGPSSAMDPSRRPSQAEPRSPYSSGTSYSLPYDGLRPSAAVDHVDELLQELREVSTELAASIRREMDLEDELDRAKTDMPVGPSMEHTRRTSDYYSDSGASSVRLPPNETGNNSLTDTKIEGLERMRRKVEQEKAQLRLEMTQKTQDDLNQRRALEMHVQSLEEQLQGRATTGERRDLEVSLEDTKRRLNEERQFKQNFEDLLGGMREELEGLRNERDNLRDEIVPQLKSRVDGLEADALEKHNLTYENTRMQQEIQSLRNENQTLVNARKMAIEMQQNHRGGFKAINEEDIDDSAPQSPRQSLSRTGSIARNKSIRHRSGSVSNKTGNEKAGEDSFKDLEDQRDALHQTLKSLVIRHDHLNKHHSKRVRVLEAERDRALTTTPRRRGSFNVEVQHLRGQVDQLRSRADDAMEQKWQCEKGLSGLKMDLDRAKQETSSLRELLQEDGALVSSRPVTPNGGSRSGSPNRSNLPESLEKSLIELKQLGPTAPSAAILLPQIEKQLEANQQLRKKLAVAIERGVREQAASEDKINEMQSSLRKAEEAVLATQQATEDIVGQQECHVRDIREVKAEKERRGVRGMGKRVPTIYTGRPGDFKAGQRTSLSSFRDTPSSPLFALRSPRLDQTSSGAGISVNQSGNTMAFEKTVRELEREANRADKEMQGVIEKMNRAQLEVAELQAERDESIKETRRLQREIIAAKEGAKAFS